MRAGIVDTDLCGVCAEGIDRTLTTGSPAGVLEPHHRALAGQHQVEMVVRLSVDGDNPSPLHTFDLFVSEKMTLS